MKYNVTMVASALALMASGVIAEPLKVGVLATLEGTYTVLGEDGVRGLKTALTEANFTAGGREIEIIIASTDASPDSAVRAARKVVEQDGVDIVIGPLSGSEGIAIRRLCQDTTGYHLSERVVGCSGNDLCDACRKLSFGSTPMAPSGPWV